MYSVMWEDNGIFRSFQTCSWNEAFDKYDKLYRKSGVTDLVIRDNEYFVEFKDYAWERNENLIGWCGSC